LKERFGREKRKRHNIAPSKEGHLMTAPRREID